MNLLLDSLPTSIIDVNGTLYFDTDELSHEDSLYNGVCRTYAIQTGYRDIIDIMFMYDSAELNNEEKTMCMIRMFYKDDIPFDTIQACKKAIEFIDCGKQKHESPKQSKDYGRLYSWDQDSDLIYSAINYSHDDILRREPNLHWWEFMSKFMQLKENCRFNDAVNNRLAHKKGKATDEQKTARKEFPDIYVLKADKKHENEAAKRSKEFERKLNS